MTILVQLDFIVSRALLLLYLARQAHTVRKLAARVRANASSVPRASTARVRMQLCLWIALKVSIAWQDRLQGPTALRARTGDTWEQRHSILAQSAHQATTAKIMLLSSQFYALKARSA